MNLGNVKETISIIYLIEIVSFLMYLLKCIHMIYSMIFFFSCQIKIFNFYKLTISILIEFVRLSVDVLLTYY